MGNNIEDSELEYYTNRAYGQLKEKIYETYRGGGTYRCPFCEEKGKEVYLYDDLLQHARHRGKGSGNMSLKQQGQHLALVSYLTKYHAPRPPCSLSNKGGRLLHSSAKQVHVAPVKSTEREMHVASDIVSRTPKSVGEKDTSVDVSRTPKSVGEKDISVDVSRTPKFVGEKDASVDKNRSQKFVYPWKGVLKNVPVEFKDGRKVFESGKKLKEHLVEQGLNPEKVTPLWNYKGFSGCCIVDFTGDWMGYENAMRFHRVFEVDHHGRMDWHKPNPLMDKLYGWVATQEDYQSDGLLRKYLKKCSLKSIEDIEGEEKMKTIKLVSHLTSSIQDKDVKSKIMAKKLQATAITINLLLDETEAMTEAYNRELSEMHRDNQERMEEMIINHEGIEKKIKSQYKQLKLREKELDRREVRNENEKRELLHQQRMNELADEVQKQVHENLMRLAEEQKKEKDALHKRTIDLEKDLDHKQALELEVERMRGAVNIMGYMGDDEDVEAKKKMEAIEEELQEKVEELDTLEDLNQALIIKEKKACEELQEALKALISGLQNTSTKGAKPSIGVKILGELDSKPFEVGAGRKYSAELANEKATEWWSRWESLIKDVSWRPFICVTEYGVTKEVINEKDESLEELRNEVGEEAYNAVVNVMTELNEYSPQDRNPPPELWNFKEQRPSNLCEGVTFLLNKWKLARKKK